MVDPTGQPISGADATCIYCRSSKGPFQSREHVVPESLIGDEIVLPVGMVCDACNSGVLSELDGYLQSSALLSIHRVLYGPERTKQGKGPRANLQNAVLHRSGAAHVEIRAKDPSGRLKDFVHLPDGTCRFSFSLRGGFDHVKIGRSLLKIGLGFLALKKGRQAALEPRFDVAREFILRGGSFPNSWILRVISVPVPGGRITFADNEPSFFILELFGLRMGFTLDTSPRLESYRGTLPLRNVGWFPMDGERESFELSSRPVEPSPSG
jgi:hypothetical protein